MNIDIQWQEPIQLTRFKKIIVDKGKLPKELENKAGVYFFSRKFGKNYVPFYIGQALELRNRLRYHLERANIYNVLSGLKGTPVAIKGGERNR